MNKIDDIKISECKYCGCKPFCHISDDLLTFTCVIECNNCHISVQSEEELTEDNAKKSAAEMWNK